MNFYYDPIKGLDYNFFEPLIMLDIGMLPKEIPTIEEALSLIKQQGFQIVNSTQMAPCVEIIPNITTNAYLCN